MHTRAHALCSVLQCVAVCCSVVQYVVEESRGRILPYLVSERKGVGCENTYRVAKTHRMPYLYRPFSAKEPYN